MATEPSHRVDRVQGRGQGRTRGGQGLGTEPTQARPRGGQEEDKAWTQRLTKFRGAAKRRTTGLDTEPSHRVDEFRGGHEEDKRKTRGGQEDDKRRTRPSHRATEPSHRVDRVQGRSEEGDKRRTRPSHRAGQEEDKRRTRPSHRARPQS